MRTRQHLYFMLLVALCAVLQTTLIQFAIPDYLRPDLFLSTVVLLGLFLGPVWGSLYAFFLGYLEDLFCGSMVGLFMFSRMVIYLAALFLSGQFYARSALAQGLLIALLGVLDAVIVEVLSLIFTQTSPFQLSNLWVIFPRSLSSGVAGVLLFPILRRIWEEKER